MHSYKYDDDFDDDEIPDQPGFDDAQIEGEAADAAAFIRRLPSIPVEQLDASEPTDTFVRLRKEGLTREEAIVILLETMVKEMTMPRGESKPDAAHLMSALAGLATAARILGCTVSTVTIYAMAFSPAVSLARATSLANSQFSLESVVSGLLCATVHVRSNCSDCPFHDRNSKAGRGRKNIGDGVGNQHRGLLAAGGVI